MMRGTGLLQERRAQVTLEMAIVTPLLIVLALIVYNLMAFSAAVARFDRVAPDIVIAHGIAPEGDGFTEASEVVAQKLQDAMAGYDVEVDVACEQESLGFGTVFSLITSPKTYRCTMRYAPWPQPFSIAGVQFGPPAYLEHERSVSVDPWKPGVVM